jgi:MFS family permease
VPSPLQSPRLRRILLAYTINRLGTWFGLLALLLSVYDHTRSSLAVAALLLAGQALPAFVVPAVVARVEASQRRRELSLLLLFEALVVGMLALLLSQFWLPAVLVLVGLDGTAALTTNALLRSEVARAARRHVQTPASGGLTAASGVASAVVGDAHEPTADGAEPPGDFDEVERKANAALNVAFSATFVAGPVLGGLIVASAGASAALLIDVGSFVICAALLHDLHPHIAAAAGNSVRARLRAAYDHIAEVPAIRTLLLVEGIAFVFFESGGPIEVAYVKATLNAGDRGVGLVLTVWGAGAVLGSIVFAHSLRRPLALMLTAGPLGIGLAYLGFAASPTLAGACAAAFVGGVGNGLQYAALFSAVQRLTPQHLHGRLMSAVESLSSLALALGLALGGALVAVSSPRGAFVVVGLGTVAASLALRRTSRRDALLSAGGAKRADEPSPAPAPAALAEAPAAHRPAAR